MSVILVPPFLLETIRRYFFYDAPDQFIFIPNFSCTVEKARLILTLLFLFLLMRPGAFSACLYPFLQNKTALVL